MTRSCSTIYRWKKDLAKKSTIPFAVVFVDMNVVSLDQGKKKCITFSMSFAGNCEKNFYSYFSLFSSWFEAFTKHALMRIATPGMMNTRAIIKAA